MSKKQLIYFLNVFLVLGFIACSKKKNKKNAPDPNIGIPNELQTGSLSDDEDTPVDILAVDDSDSNIDKDSATEDKIDFQKIEDFVTGGLSPEVANFMQKKIVSIETLEQIKIENPYPYDKKSLNVCVKSLKNKLSKYSSENNMEAKFLALETRVDGFTALTLISKNHHNLHHASVFSIEPVACKIQFITDFQMLNDNDFFQENTHLIDQFKENMKKAKETFKANKFEIVSMAEVSPGMIVSFGILKKGLSKYPLVIETLSSDGQMVNNVVRAVKFKKKMKTKCIKRKKLKTYQPCFLKGKFLGIF
jgi:hypothetical protein